MKTLGHNIYTEDNIHLYYSDSSILSSKYPCPIKYQGVIYKSVQCAFDNISKKDWTNNQRYELMFELNSIKFNWSNPKFMQFLMHTKDLELIYKSDDPYWGLKNMSGKSLMRVRRNLRKDKIWYVEVYYDSKRLVRLNNFTYFSARARANQLFKQIRKNKHLEKTKVKLLHSMDFAEQNPRQDISFWKYMIRVSLKG